MVTGLLQITNTNIPWLMSNTLNILGTAQAGKSYRRGKFSTVDLLVETSLDQLYIEMSFTFFTKYATLMRRSTVLILSPQLVFPVQAFHLAGNQSLYLTKGPMF
jgi:hypothetical protein